MRRLPKLFVILYIVHLCYCDGDDKCFNEPDKIYLLASNNSDYDNLNEVFQERVREITNAIIEYTFVDGMPLTKALATIPSDNVAIHLHVGDFYQKNYDDILKLDYRFAGDIELHVCQNQTSEDNDECERIAKNVTKLVSRSLDYYPRLLHFVTSFQYHDQNDIDGTDPCEPMVFVVCGRSEIRSRCNIMQSKIRIETTSSCETYNFHNTERIVAVLAPEPFNLDEKLNILTVFYDQMEMDEIPDIKDMFLNGETLVKKEEKIHDAFLKFIQTMEWNRVAIISDDSLISKEFEENLTSLFDEQNIIYGSKSCAIPNCDYHEVLTPIMMADPKIVIANVAEEKAHKFATEAARWNKNIVWLVRAWSPTVAQSAAVELGNVVSITLGLTLHKHYIPSVYEFEPRNLDVLMSIINNKDLYRNLESLERVREEFLRRVQNKQKDISAYVSWYWGQDNRIQSAKTTIDMSNLREKNCRWDIEPPQITSDLNDCIFKSGVYFYPCNDIEFILIMLVFSIFALSVLGIIYFYEMAEEQPVSRNHPRVREYERMTR